MCSNSQIIFDISYCTAFVNIDIHAFLLLEFLLELDVSTINYIFYYLLFNPTAACCYFIMPIITVQSEVLCIIINKPNVVDTVQQQCVQCSVVIYKIKNLKSDPHNYASVHVYQVSSMCQCTSIKFFKAKSVKSRQQYGNNKRQYTGYSNV